MPVVADRKILSAAGFVHRPDALFAVSVDWKGCDPLNTIVSAWVTDGFDTPDLKEAKALLDNLR